MSIGALHDLDFPASCRANHRGGLCARISSIGEDAFDEGKARSCLVQKVSCCVSVLYVCGQNDDVQQKAERIDKDVALSSRDLLACVIALRVQSRAPF